MTEAASKLQSDLDDLIGELAEEYAQRLRNGEKPDIEEYTRQYPDAADAIRQILPALEIMGAVPGEEAHENGEPAFSNGQNKALGDFEIIREVGRGGMGVVYEAQQLSLSRRVALKVLPFAAVLDERQIQRFRNEAMAAAQLDHPHIVDVYGVGCERSVHFYAMRYVEGDTLAEAIAELRRLQQSTGPSPPIVLESESSGDMPTGDSTPALAALSTQRSASGREYFRSVARIGVEVASALDHAHQQGVIHRGIKPANVIIDATGKSWITDFGLARMESGATLTMTGDLLGTLRYMSPEQALAKRVVVDHRTDVYSLGVTLYELLTLQPAYGNEDRHELLRKIAFEEPKSPRKLNRAVPEELETIVLKAIAKNPNDRYETAQELADDLDCFLDGRPVSARRPTLTQQVTNWSRRHWQIVSSAAAVLILLTTVLAVSTALIWSEQRRTEAALKQAEANFELAESSARTAQAAAGEAERQRRIAEQRADEVEIQNRRAVIHLSLALLVIETEPSLNHVRTLLDSGSADPEALIEIARILVEQFPEERGAWKLLAEAYDAADRHREALDQFDWYTVNRPDSPDAYNRLAWLLADCRDVSLRDPERAVIVAQRAVTLDPTNSWFLNTLGVAHYRAGNWEEAAEAFEDSIAFGWDDGFNSFYLAMCHCRLGRPDEARRFYAAALEKQRPALPIAGRELRRIREEADALMELGNGRGPAAQ